MEYLRFPLLLTAVMISGCGGGGGSESVVPPDVSPRDAVKATLEQIAESGQGGSEIGAMMQDLEKLKETDAATADALIQDANALMSTTGGKEAITAKAKEMLAKLESGSGG